MRARAHFMHIHCQPACLLRHLAWTTWRLASKNLKPNTLIAVVGQFQSGEMQFAVASLQALGASQQQLTHADMSLIVPSQLLGLRSGVLQQSDWALHSDSGSQAPPSTFIERPELTTTRLKEVSVVNNCGYLQRMQSSRQVGPIW